MMRFIYLCMGVVALSVLSIAMQPATDGIQLQRAKIIARNAPQPEPVLAAMDDASEELDFSPENLNNIESAAGDDGNTSDDDFGASFTNTAPKALEDRPQSEDNIY